MARVVETHGFVFPVDKRSISSLPVHFSLTLIHLVQPSLRRKWRFLKILDLKTLDWTFVLNPLHRNLLFNSPLYHDLPLNPSTSLLYHRLTFLLHITDLRVWPLLTLPLKGYLRPLSPLTFQTNGLISDCFLCRLSISGLLSHLSTSGLLNCLVTSSLLSHLPTTSPTPFHTQQRRFPQLKRFQAPPQRPYPPPTTRLRPPTHPLTSLPSSSSPPSQVPPLPLHPSGTQPQQSSGSRSQSQQPSASLLESTPSLPPIPQGLSSIQPPCGGPSTYFSISEKVL